jgi:hypothetical protein
MGAEEKVMVSKTRAIRTVTCCSSIPEDDAEIHNNGGTKGGRIELLRNSRHKSSSRIGTLVDVNAAPGGASKSGLKAWSWGMKVGKGYEDSGLGRTEGGDLPQTKPR